MKSFFLIVNIYVLGEVNMVVIKGLVFVGENNVDVDISVSYLIEYCFYNIVICFFCYCLFVLFLYFNFYYCYI